MNRLRRPRLLLRAARHGLAHYNRDAVLGRLLPDRRPAGAEDTIDLLLSQEAAMDQTRRDGDACYSVAGHVELLIALIAEVRLHAHQA